MSLWVVVGGQFGSEGKGKVSAFIVRQENIDICVRCGGPNSGHSFVGDKGETTVLRQLPTGFLNPNTRLMIPAGALIDPIVLKEEIEALNLPPERIGIDRNAFVIQANDRAVERDLGLKERLSSTLCGVGSAVSRRVLRGDDSTLAKDAIRQHTWLGPLITNVSAEVNSALNEGKSALIEGTQGFGLSLYHSDHFPHCTSRDTTAAAFLSEVGVSPKLVSEIVVVLRTFPIRVAGEQAGPMENEITWDLLRKESGYPHDIKEFTSVTRALRRVARFDWNKALTSIAVNRPTKLAINGLDYLDYTNSAATRPNQLTQIATSFISELEQRSNTPVGYVGVGPALSQIISGDHNLETRAIDSLKSVA
jgi:adenylosuccinate synthase